MGDALVLTGHAAVCAVIGVFVLLIGFLITPSSYPSGPQFAAAQLYVRSARLLSDAFPLVAAGTLLGGLALILSGASLRRAGTAVWAAHGVWWLALAGTYVLGAVAGAYRVPFISH